MNGQYGAVIRRKQKKTDFFRLFVMCIRQTDEEVLVSRLIEKAMRRSRALDTEGLCIVAGEKVWMGAIAPTGTAFMFFCSGRLNRYLLSLL